MARPRKEGLDYFSHDTDALNDEKIEALRLLYGNDGYAFYFILLERIYRTRDAELDVSDAETMQILAKKVAVTDEKFNRMLDTSLKQGCFDTEAYEKRKVLTSNGIKKRTEFVVGKRVKSRESYQKNKKEVSDAETGAETGETKQNKTKQNNNTSRSKLKFETHHMKLAELLFNEISKNMPKRKEPNYEQWANSFRLMMERDKREGKEIQDVLLWSQKHHFWYKNILSPDKLREQFDRLQAEMNEDNNVVHFQQKTPKVRVATREEIDRMARGEE